MAKLKRETTPLRQIRTLCSVYEQEWLGSFYLILPVLRTASTLLLPGRRRRNGPGLAPVDFWYLGLPMEVPA